MRGRVFVTGAGGFVGSAVVPALLDSGHQVAALSRSRPIDRKGSEPLWTVIGDLFDDDALAKGLDGATAVVHLVGIIAERPRAGVTFERVHDEGTARLVAAAKTAGVTRFVYVSALGARPDAPSAYHQTKFAAEQHVRTGGLDWTIVQPSLIHGPGGDFTKMLAGWARGTAVPYWSMPYFGAGPLGRGPQYQVQPIHVADVARAIADSLEKPGTVGEVYPIGGPDRMTWPQMYRTAANAVVGHDRPIMPIPAWYAELLTRVIPRSPAAVRPQRGPDEPRGQRVRDGEIRRHIWMDAEGVRSHFRIGDTEGPRIGGVPKLCGQRVSPPTDSAMTLNSGSSLACRMTNRSREASWAASVTIERGCQVARANRRRRTDVARRNTSVLPAIASVVSMA